MWCSRGSDNYDRDGDGDRDWTFCTPMTTHQWGVWGRRSGVTELRVSSQFYHVNRVRHEDSPDENSIGVGGKSGSPHF